MSSQEPKEKIDLSKLTPEERQIYEKYGKLPSKKPVGHAKLKERKYFDSGDYALYKAGKGSAPVGMQHPSPDSIPHSVPSKDHQPIHAHHFQSIKPASGTGDKDKNTTASVATTKTAVKEVSEQS